MQNAENNRSDNKYPYLFGCRYAESGLPGGGLGLGGREQSRRGGGGDRHDRQHRRGARRGRARSRRQLEQVLN